ncbi:phage portal protein [Pyruvatibacter sp. HU-CL02332]
MGGANPKANMPLFPWLSRRTFSKTPARMPETKASRTGPVVALHLQGRPRWTPRDYAALAREGLEKNPIVYRAVRRIAESAASVPLLMYQGNAELESHPLLDLLARPNPMEEGSDVRCAFFAHLQTAGNAYMEAVEVDGTPRELYALRPDRMKVVPGPQGWPEAYEYASGGETVAFALPDTGPMTGPILHLKLFHPTDDHYGMSPLEAAAFAIDIHNAAGAWNKALLDNAARPSGALVYAGAEGAEHLTDEQFTRLKEELEQNYQGSDNAGRPLLLEGGLDWKAMSLSPKDMDFIEAKNVASREIALAFGIPPMLLGIPGDNTYANYAEANRAFWRETVLPLVGRYCHAITNWLAPRYGDNLRIWYDPDALEALNADREALWERIGAADFLGADEKRRAVGYGEK